MVCCARNGTVSWHRPCRDCAGMKTTIIAALLAAALPAAAQDRARTWIGAGLGTGGARRSSEALAMMGELVHQRGANHWALRAVSIREPYGDGSRSLSDVGLLYGRVAK